MTLPEPYSTDDEIDIIAKTVIYDVPNPLIVVDYSNDGYSLSFPQPPPRGRYDFAWLFSYRSLIAQALN